MKVKSAEFTKSSFKITQKPERKLPEFAFIGRSNVGKSSLINYLAGKKDLAKTSSMPGKTLLINHFTINDAWYMVDLPGYGFAKVSKTQKDKISRIIDEYINLSEDMAVLFVLLDARHEIMKIDLDFLIHLGENGIPFSIIFTKGDKLGPTALQNMVEKNRQILLQYWEELPPVFITSAEKKQGGEEVLDYIEQILSKL